jgi:hypothetical protein
MPLTQSERDQIAFAYNEMIERSVNKKLAEEVVQCLLVFNKQQPPEAAQSETSTIDIDRDFFEHVLTEAVSPCEWAANENAMHECHEYLRQVQLTIDHTHPHHSSHQLYLNLKSEHMINSLRHNLHHKQSKKESTTTAAEQQLQQQESEQLVDPSLVYIYRPRVLTPVQAYVEMKRIDMSPVCEGVLRAVSKYLVSMTTTGPVKEESGGVTKNRKKRLRPMTKAQRERVLKHTFLCLDYRRLGGGMNGKTPNREMAVFNENAGNYYAIVESDWQTAFEYYKQALSIFEKLVGSYKSSFAASSFSFLSDGESKRKGGELLGGTERREEDEAAVARLFNSVAKCYMIDSEFVFLYILFVFLIGVSSWLPVFLYEVFFTSVAQFF